MANLNETSRIIREGFIEAGDGIVDILNRATRWLNGVFRHRVDDTPEYVGKHRFELVPPQLRVVAQW